MANRMFIHPDQGIVISKPGKDATNPSLPDDDKIFDSHWAFSGQIVFCRLVRINHPNNVHNTNTDFMYGRTFSDRPAVEAQLSVSSVEGLIPQPVKPTISPQSPLLLGSTRAVSTINMGPNGTITALSMNDRVRINSTRTVATSGNLPYVWILLKVFIV